MTETETRELLARVFQPDRVAIEQIREKLRPIIESHFNTIMLELQSGSVFVRYDSELEKQACELVSRGVVDVIAFFPYGYKVQLVKS